MSVANRAQVFHSQVMTRKLCYRQKSLSKKPSAKPKTKTTTLKRTMITKTPTKTTNTKTTMQKKTTTKNTQEHTANTVFIYIFWGWAFLVFIESMTVFVKVTNE